MKIQERVTHFDLGEEYLSFLRAISVDCLELNPTPWSEQTGDGEGGAAVRARLC